MSQPIENPVISYVTNGVTTTFPYPFSLQERDDLVVTLNNVVITTGFTVSNVGIQGGGDVVFSVAPAASQTLVLARVIEAKREDDYQDTGPWDSKQVNRDFDRIWQFLQLYNAHFEQSIKLPIGSADQTIDAAPEDRAHNLIGFDAAGNVTVLVPTDLDLALVSVFMAGMLALENAADLRDALELGGAALLDPGTTPGDLIEIDSSGKIPALDGSQLLNVKRPGDVLQSINAVQSAFATGAALIPSDNTIPQITEGFIVLGSNITPMSATSKLVVEFQVFCAASAAGRLTAALFKDSNADAILVSSVISAANGLVQLNAKGEFPAGTTSLIDFQVRIGNSVAATTTFNGASGAGLYGNTLNSYLRITEVMQ